MTPPRFSLYGDASVWSGNVQEDVEGRWLKWKDTEAYVQYALAHGYVPPVPVESKPQLRVDMVEKGHISPEQIDMYPNTITIDDDADLVDLMTGLKQDLEEEV